MRSYCIVPKVRGKEVSHRPGEILAEVTNSPSRAFVRLTLLGQNVNSWGRDLAPDVKTDFAELLRACDAVPGIERIRFTSPHPKDFRRELIAAMAECDAVCEHAHLPLQSGSTRILKAMKRTYSRERYLRLADEMRRGIPDLALSTDIIVGFPGETDRDFEETLEVVEEVGYDSAFTFVFSPRSGTDAATMPDQVPEDVKQQRIERLTSSSCSKSRTTATRRAWDASSRSWSKAGAAPTPLDCESHSAQHERELHRLGSAERARRGAHRWCDLHNPARHRVGRSRSPTRSAISPGRACSTSATSAATAPRTVRRRDMAVSFEADSIRRLTDSGWQALLDYGIKTIIDLRTDQELQADPPAEMPLEIQHISLFDEDPLVFMKVESVAEDAPDAATATRDVYLIFLESFKHNVAAAIRAVAQAPEGGVVVHCMGGKDRTGLITGVPPPHRRRRYRADRRRLCPQRRAAQAPARRVVRECGGSRARATTPIAQTPAESIVGVFEELERRYGSVEVPRRRRPERRGPRAHARDSVTNAVLALFGPTASGKTAVAEAVAERIPAEVVSADSMQVYRGLPILTAQPKRPTRLVAIWELEHLASLGEYQHLAHEAIDEVLATGKTPFVVGGTGLYFRAALADLDLPPAPPPGARKRWESVYDDEGGERAHELLAERDPEAAAAVHPNDRRRVVRALELAESGASLRSGRNRLWTEETRHPTVVFGLDLARGARPPHRGAGARDVCCRACRGGARPPGLSLGHGALRAGPGGAGRARRRRGRTRGADPPDEALRVLPAQMDAAHSGPC